MPRSRDQQAPSWNTRQGAAPRVGRVPQVSFHDRNLLVFERNDSPLARGRLQNAKWKEQVRTHSISELPNLSQKPGRLARKISGRRRRCFAGIKTAPPLLRASGGDGGAYVSNTYSSGAHGFPRYGKPFMDFSTLWKIFGRFFHAMEFSTQWKNFFHSVENSDFGLFSGVLGCSLGAVERSTRRPLSTVERADRGAGKNGARRRRAAPSAAPASGAA